MPYYFTHNKYHLLCVIKGNHQWHLLAVLACSAQPHGTCFTACNAAHNGTNVHISIWKLESALLRHCCQLYNASLTQLTLPEFTLLSAEVSSPHITFGNSLSTATAAPRLPTLLLAPANIVTPTSSQ